MLAAWPLKMAGALRVLPHLTLICLTSHLGLHPRLYLFDFHFADPDVSLMLRWPSIYFEFNICVLADIAMLPEQWLQTYDMTYTEQFTLDFTS